MPVKFKRKAIKLDAFSMDEIDTQIPEEAQDLLDRLSAKLDEAIGVIEAQGTQIEESKTRITEAQAKIEQLQGATRKVDELQAKLDQTTEELTKAKADVAELSDMDSPRVQGMLRAKKDLEGTADLLKVDWKDKSPREIKMAIIRSVSPEFNHEGRSDEYINARYDSVVEFVLQARSDANNNKLGEFIRQAHDSKAPKDPRAEFIRKSQELSQVQ